MLCHESTAFYTTLRTSVTHTMVFPSVIIHEIVLCTCAQTLVMHKLVFHSMHIRYTVFYAFIRLMAKHKLAFSSVEMPYTVNGASSFTSEVNELGFSSMNKNIKHYSAHANIPSKCINLHFNVRIYTKLLSTQHYRLRSYTH